MNKLGCDNEGFEEPVRRVSYWSSSLYNENGIHYLAGGKPRGSTVYGVSGIH